jgi:hypothetical protein
MIDKAGVVVFGKWEEAESLMRRSFANKMLLRGGVLDAGKLSPVVVESKVDEVLCELCDSLSKPYDTREELPGGAGGESVLPDFKVA